jgi:hypothetical protein
MTWYVHAPQPVGFQKVSQWGPYTLEVAEVVQAALESATGYYMTIKDANGNWPT